ncbi:TolC family protein [Candidatus Neomarinimicrobiota bacterium]
MTISLNKKVLKYLFITALLAKTSVYSVESTAVDADSVETNKLSSMNISSISTALDYVLEYNSEIIAADNAYRAAVEIIHATGVLPDPMIEGTIFVDPIETRNGPIENQFMVGQKIPLWGKLKRQRSAAGLMADNAFLALQNKKVKVSFQLRSSWAHYIKLKNSITILENYKAELESFRRVALSQYSTGKGKTQHPILKLQIEQSLIESQINSMEASLERTINELQTLFNGTFKEDLITDDWDIDIPANSTKIWLDIAHKTAPSYLISKNNVDLASIHKELTVRKNYPDLVAGLTYSIVDETELPGAPSSGKDAFGVKLGLNLPVWFKRNKARVQSSTLNIKAKEASHENSWNQIEGEIISAIKEYYEAEETYFIYRDNLVQESEQLLASAFSAYETGNISFLDLLDSERMIVKVRLEHEAAILNHRVASAKLLKTIGLIEGMER